MTISHSSLENNIALLRDTVEKKKFEEKKILKIFLFFLFSSFELHSFVKK
jgi:hypothetical protein